jgi:hypothetical protein
MRKISGLSILYCFILTSSITLSQEEPSNFAMWNSVSVKYSPIKNLKLSVEQNLRLKENASVTDEYFTEISLGYEIVKDLEIGGGVRFIKENDNVGKKQGYEKHFRYNFDVSFKHDIKRVVVSYRFRYQNKKELDLVNADESLPKENVRFKTSIEYNIRKWPLDPKLSIEGFSDLLDIRQVRDLGLNKYRVTFGTGYDLGKFGKFGIYYRLQENINSNFTNEKTKILGLKYSYSIK